MTHVSESMPDPLLEYAPNPPKVNCHTCLAWPHATIDGLGLAGGLSDRQLNKDLRVRLTRDLE
jgi:hypothetical protein